MSALRVVPNSCRVLAILIMSLVGLASGASGQARAEDLFQQALRMERVSGDLEGAIGLYQKVVETRDRSFGARALIRIAESYEKLGRAGARDAYTRVIAEFGDQTEQVALARRGLAALRRPAEAPRAKTISTRKLWSGPGEPGPYDPMPDGEHILVGDDQQTMNLLLRDLSTGESHYLTRDAGVAPVANTYGGRVSPDGKWVAHGFSVWREGGSLRVVGVDGTGLRTLLEEPGCWIQPHEWTSDSRQIVGRWDCWSDSNPDGTHQIVMVSVADGTTRVVREVPNIRVAFRAWLSPDDRYLVYDGPVEEADGNRDIWLSPLNGGPERPLVRHPADDHVLGWVPGSDFVVFLSDRDGTWDLWAVAVQDGAPRGAPRKIWRDMGEVDPVGFSEDGTFFYSVFTRWFNTSIAPFDVATGMADLDTATPLLGSNREPQWSPDGRRLAFNTESELTEGKRGRLNILDLDTGEQKEIESSLRVRHLGEWSPDGRSLLLAGDDGDSELGFWTVDVSAGQASPVAPVPGADSWQGGWTATGWSRDGRAILYSTMDDGTGRSRLVRRDTGSGEEEELYRDSLVIRRPLALSPDGHQVAFVFMDSVDAEGPAGLAALDLGSGTTRRLVTFDDSLSGWELSLQWTPDGKSLLYSRSEQGGDEWRTKVWRVATGGGDPEYLWAFGEDKWGGWFRLSPDGHQIALTTYTQDTEVWVMENLKEVLQTGGSGEGS